MNKNRIVEIDTLRGLTFIAIVLQHTLASFIYNPGVSKSTALTAAFFLTLARYAVPMFIFITGMVLFYNYSDQLDYLVFLKKRFMQILVPYLTWTFIYFIWTSLLSGMPATSLGSALQQIFEFTLNGKGYYHLWFMVTILQFYLLFPLFKRLIAPSLKTNALIIFTLLLFHIGLLWFYSCKLPYIYSTIEIPLIKTLFDYRDRIFISWLFYFMLGGYAGLYFDRLAYFLKKSLPYTVLIFMGSGGLILYRLIDTLQINPEGGYILNYQFTGPLNYLMTGFITSAIMLLYYGSQTSLKQHPGTLKILNIFGKYSLGGYFIHAFVLYYIKTICHDHLLWMNVPELIIFSFAACSLISLLTCFMINKIKVPVGNMVVGKVSVN